MNNPVNLLRKMALSEGVSFLLLLGIAMPLKYVWGQPMAVRVIGLIHGVLFIAFIALLIYVKVRAKWPLGRTAVIFFAALIPFGPWLVDRRMHEYAREFKGCYSDAFARGCDQ